MDSRGWGFAIDCRDWKHASISVVPFVLLCAVEESPAHVGVTRAREVKACARRSQSLRTSASDTYVRR
jgi:hypothetical protein